MTSLAQGNIISPEVEGYLHDMFAKLRISKFSVSFRPYDVIFSLPSKKPEVDFEYMKISSCSQRTS